MIRCLFLLFASISFVFNSFANDPETSLTEKPANLKINGIVIDKQTGEPLVGVKIMLSGSEQVVYSDFDGKYTLVVPTGQAYTLTCSYVSYESVSISGSSNTSNNNSNQCNFELVPVKTLKIEQPRNEMLLVNLG